MKSYSYKTFFMLALSDEWIPAGSTRECQVRVCGNEKFDFAGMRSYGVREWEVWFCGNEKL